MDSAQYGAQRRLQQRREPRAAVGNGAGSPEPRAVIPIFRVGGRENDASNALAGAFAQAALLRRCFGGVLRISTTGMCISVPRGTLRTPASAATRSQPPCEPFLAAACCHVWRRYEASCCLALPGHTRLHVISFLSASSLDRYTWWSGPVKLPWEEFSRASNFYFVVSERRHVHCKNALLTQLPAEPALSIRSPPRSAGRVGATSLAGYIQHRKCADLSAGIVARRGR